MPPSFRTRGLRRAREELFLAFTGVQNGNQWEVTQKNAETLRTTNYPPSPDSYGGQAADVTDTCSGGADADALQYGHAIHRALQIRVISVIRG